jgi:hypothetical protein
MFRSTTCFGVAALVAGLAAPIAAQELVAPSPAVAAAWAQEASDRRMGATRPSASVERVLAPSDSVAAAWAQETRERRTANPTSRSLKAVYVSYGVLQGLDMYSTIVARQNGAREVNPTMNVGYAQAALVKGLMATGTFAAVKKIEQKNKKAAVMTMVVMNVVTAAVVANNFRNARRVR